MKRKHDAAARSGDATLTLRLTAHTSTSFLSIHTNIWFTVQSEGMNEMIRYWSARINGICKPDWHQNNSHFSCSSPRQLCLCPCDEDKSRCLCLAETEDGAAALQQISSALLSCTLCNSVIVFLAVAFNHSLSESLTGNNSLQNITYGHIQACFCTECTPGSPVLR